jgi:hypothetical protein
MGAQMLRRVWPLAFHQSPLDIFSLLLLNHGFPAGEFAAVAKAAWKRIVRQPPLSGLEPGFTQRFAVTAFFEDSAVGAGAPDLGVTQAGARLELAASADQRLRTYLGTRSVTSNGETIGAANVWPLFGSGGRGGSLVVVLHKGQQPAELDAVTPTAALRTPLVAVSVAGDHWEKPAVRGLCQLLAGLVDEYELPGAEFERAPAALTDFPAPNVLFVSDEQRTQLVAGVEPAKVIPGLAQLLPIGLWQTVAFHPHEGAEPNPPPAQRANGRVQLVEGGNGYRSNALRTDFDCLMRRRPGDPALPVQQDVPLCKTCREAVRQAISSPTEFPYARRVLLHNQRPLFDEVTWPSIETVRAFPFRRTLTTGPPDPIWSCTVDVTAQDGLEITDLKLANRPDDPFSAATDVMSLIEFKELEVELADGTRESLPAAKAFQAAKGLAGPTLQIAFDGGARKQYRIGVKLTAWFLVADAYAVEATFSLVLKDKAADIDPGGAALACKLYPQLSLRHVRPPVPPEGPPAELPAVEALRGTVSVWCNNTIPASMHHELMAVDEHLAHMATGANAATAITDANDGPRDATYDGPLPPMSFKQLVQSEAHWVSGRKLAGLELTTEPETLAATLYRWHRRGWVAQVLPHWSWLFDYVIPTLGGTSEFVAVYAAHETTRGGAAAAEPRTDSVRWPPSDRQASPPHAYELTVRKVPRQGAYDNVHVAALMGDDEQGRPITSAPFCADKCLHVHWRWGLIPTEGAATPFPFHGWGTGRLDSGAHTVRGAPLIPPNQHLDIRVHKEAAGLAGIDYKVTAWRPGRGEAQVLLEQGISFAFAYSGLRLDKVGALATALDLQQFSPTFLGVRRLFHRVYPVIRWFDTAGEMVVGNVQQIPGPPTSTDSLPRLEAL